MNATATSLFDPNTFLTQEQAGGFETKYPVIPAGEYPAISKKLDFRQMDATDPTKGKYNVLDITWGIDDAGVKEATKLPEPTCRQSIFLDIGEDGKLARGTGKNVQLGRLLEALGLNDPNVPFSFSQLVGRPALVRIEQSPNQKDPDNPYSNVTKVGTM